MPIERKVVNFPLAVGVDQKSDPRASDPPKLAVAQNVVFEEIGGIQKRPGTSGLTLTTDAAASISAAYLRGVATCQDEALLFAKGVTWSYNDVNQRWLNRGRFESVLVDQKTVGVNRKDQVTADRAHVGSVTLYAWYENQGASSGVGYQCVDSTTGAVFTSATATQFITAAKYPKCRAVGGKLHLYYFDGTVDIKVVVIDPTTVYTTLNTAGVSVSAAHDAQGAFDVTILASRSVLAYRTAGNLAKLALIGAAGTVSSTVATGRTASGIIAVDYNATPDRISLVRSIGATDLKHDWIKNDLSDDTTVNTAVVTGEATNIQNCATVVMTGQIAWIAWDIEGPSPVPTYPVAKLKTCTAGGALGTTKALAHRAKLGSRFARYNGNGTDTALIHVYHSSPLQTQYFLMDARYTVAAENGATAVGDEPGILARLLPGQGPAIPTSNSGALFAGGTLPQIDMGTTDVAYYFAGTFTRHLYAPVLTYGSYAAPSTPLPFAERGTKDFTYTFQNAAAYRGVELGLQTFLPGGYVAQYDGARVYENGFFLYPEMITFSQNAAGGVRAQNSTYYYRFQWEWRNAHGELERSTSVPVQVVIGASGTATNKITFTVPTLAFTSKLGVLLAVYLSTDGVNYYRISATDPTATSGYVLNDYGADNVTFTDDNGLATDTQMLGNELNYLNSGELDNVSTTATKWLASGQARLFSGDPEDVNLIRYSKLRSSGDVPAYNDALQAVVPQDGGDVTVVDAADTQLVVFKQDQIYVIAGIGPDNLGVGSYGQPQRVADVGCITTQSMTYTPIGWAFRSRKGIYLLTDSFQTHYIGSDVADTDDTWTGVTLADKHQVRFYGTTQGCLMFDFNVKQWSIWPACTASAAVIWNSAPLILGTDAPRTENALFTDVSVLSVATDYSIVIETSWIKLDGLQGFYRARRMAILGEYRDAHDLRVRVRYDFDDITASWTDDFTWTVSPTTVGGPERVTISFSRQKCEAVRIRIEDVAHGVSALRESVKLTGLSLQYGVKGGLPRLGVSQRK